MACEHELVDRFGGTWTDDDARSIIGFDLLDAAVVLRDRGGVDIDPHAIVERMLDGVIARVREHVPWRPGARRLLTELNDLGVPCALVTMSWRRLADAILEELAPIHFDVVVTGDDVRDGKPHPEPYLRRAAALGVDPTECVAIEDSPTGVASATAAGCVVVAVPHIVRDRAGAGPLRRRQPEVGHAGRPRRATSPRRRRRRRRRRPAGGGAATTPAAAGRSSAAPPCSSRSSWRSIVAAVTRRRRRRPAAASTGAARRPGVDAVLGARRRPARARGARRHASTSCRRSGSGPPASTRSRSRPRRRPTRPQQFIETARRHQSPARRLDPRRHQGRRDGRHPRRPGPAGPPRRRHRDVRRRRRLRRHRHRLRAVRLRRRPRHVGGDAPELGGVHRRAVAAAARRRAHADRQHPAGLRRRPDRRQRLLGLRLRRHHAARRHASA